MPWTAADAERFKKGLSRRQKKKWAAVANGALASCMEGGSSEKECAGRAVRIANSKFSSSFNGVLSNGEATRLLARAYDMDMECPECPEEKKAEMRRMMKKCLEKGGTADECKAEAMLAMKSFQQHREESYPDPQDGHTHECAFDEDGNGSTNVAGTFPHSHQIWNFKLQPFYFRDPVTNAEYSSSHPGSLAFEEHGDMTPEMRGRLKKCMDSGKTREECMASMKREMSDLGECEMEIFRPGTHNGDEFTEADLEEIAKNFRALKGELRPKLKITHHGEDDEQKSLAGLASYGDVVDVFLRKAADGTRRLFAKVANVPKQVLEWIKERRFPERSIELYPAFRLGTEEESPTYRNVLKAVALLGHEMPAVTGMAPVALAAAFECQGTHCFRERVYMSENAEGAGPAIAAMAALEMEMSLGLKGGE